MRTRTIERDQQLWASLSNLTKRSKNKFDCLKDIVYDILPPKIVKLYCTSDIRKYKWENDENGKRQIKTENGIKLNNGSDLHRNCWGLLITAR